MPGFAYYVIQRNDTINDSIFDMSNGMQETLTINPVGRLANCDNSGLDLFMHFEVCHHVDVEDPILIGHVDAAATGNKLVTHYPTHHILIHREIQWRNKLMVCK